MWEWHSYILVNEYKILRWEIVGDTIIDGQHYFVQHFSDFDTDTDTSFLDLRRFFVAFLRYDTTRTRIVGLSTRDPVPVELDYTCDLNADFGAITTCHGDEIMVSGGYTTTEELSYWRHLIVGQDTLEIAAGKGFRVAQGVFETYLNGMGQLREVGDGAAGQVTLIYLRLDGVEYGASVVATGVEEDPEDPIEPYALSVYPNPARDRATIAYRLPPVRHALVEVFNVLGQRIRNESIQGSGAMTGWYELDTASMASGIYLVRIATSTGVQMTRPIIVTK